MCKGEMMLSVDSCVGLADYVFYYKTCQSQSEDAGDMAQRTVGVLCIRQRGVA